jgi:hypothetical protein
MKIKFSLTDRRSELGMPRDEEMQSISDLKLAVCVHVCLSVCLCVCDKYSLKIV